MSTIMKLLAWMIVAMFVSLQPAEAQKTKEKENFKKGKAVFNKLKNFKNQLNHPTSTTTKPTNENQQEPLEKSNTPKNRKLTPPDVRLQIYNASQSFGKDDFSTARYYIKQAIMGIELEIGNQILQSMPETIEDNKADKSLDEVYSTGAGFVGLVISREYPADKGYIKASIGSNSVLFSSAGIQASMQSQSMGYGDENTKSMLYKGNKASLEVDEYDGYKMVVPFGQSSVFVLECSLCETEAQLIKIADQFDIDQYKSLLGEQ